MNSRNPEIIPVRCLCTLDGKYQKMNTDGTWQSVDIWMCDDGKYRTMTRTWKVVWQWRGDLSFGHIVEAAPPRYRRTGLPERDDPDWIWSEDLQND